MIQATQFARHFYAELASKMEQKKALPWTSSSAEETRILIRSLALNVAYANGAGGEAAEALAEFAILAIRIDGLELHDATPERLLEVRR